MTDLVERIVKHVEESIFTASDVLLEEAATALEAKDKELAALREELESYAALAMKEDDCRKMWQARAETAERERDHFKSKAHEYFGMYDVAMRERDEARDALTRRDAAEQALKVAKRSGAKVHPRVAAIKARAITGEKP